MKYTKYLAILAAAFMMGSCSDDFLDKEPSENASEDQIKDLLDKDPTAIQAYITGYYKNMFSPEAQQSHDDFGLKAFELATDLMGDDMAYMTSHFFVYDKHTPVLHMPAAFLPSVWNNFRSKAVHLPESAPLLLPEWKLLFP